MKNQFRVLAFLGVVFSLLIFTFSLTTCSNPTGDEESGEMGTFTINLGGNGRLVGYPPTSEINNIKFVVTFKQGATVTGPFTADGTYTMTEKIPIGVYDTVEVEVFDKTDGNSVLAVGGLTSGGPITIHTGNNAIHVTLNKTVKVSPDLHTVVVGNTKQFTASVYNSSPTVTWTISSSFTGATTGINLSSGLLTVDPLETASVIEVTATYTTDPTWRGSTKVDISDGGSGSPTDPFIVYDEITLTRVGKGTGGWTGNWSLSASYKQIEDITLPATNWTPIGAIFTGTYDGNGKTISGLYYNGTGRIGLFDTLNGASVKDLSLTVNFTTTGSSAVAGAVAVSSNGRIENCHVLAGSSINANGSAGMSGGIVGSSSGATALVQGCSFTGTVSHIGSTGAGGIAGDISVSSKVLDCYFSGTITGGSGSVV